MLIVIPELDEEQVENTVGRFRTVIERTGGEIGEVNNWGRRKLAYEIAHKGEGFYHLLQFTCEAGTLDEISRVLRIDDGVLRHMATRRIEGSPARPVAVGSPTREDAGTASPADGQGAGPVDGPADVAADAVDEPIEEEEE